MFNLVQQYKWILLSIFVFIFIYSAFFYEPKKATSHYCEVTETFSEEVKLSGFYLGDFNEYLPTTWYKDENKYYLVYPTHNPLPVFWSQGKEVKYPGELSGYTYLDPNITPNPNDGSFTANFSLLSFNSKPPFYDDLKDKVISSEVFRARYYINNGKEYISNPPNGYDKPTIHKFFASGVCKPK